MIIEKLYVQKDNEPEFEIHDRIDGILSMGITKIAPQVTPQAQQIVGTDGEIVYSNFYGPSTVKLKVYLDGHDVYDYKLLVSELYRMFYARNPIRIRDEVEPNIVYYVIAKPANITTINFTQGSAEIEFINPKGFRYSIKNSDALVGTDYQFGMNATNNDDTHGSIGYHFNNNNFWIYNDSDVTIDPYINRHELKVTMHCDGQPTIKNNTTNTSIAINNQIKHSDEFILNGVDSFLNGQPYGINTDLGYLTLAKGWNSIEIDGANNLDIIFSFPFIYL